MTNAVFRAGPTARAEALVASEISLIDGLADSVTTLWTPRASGQAGRDAVTVGTPLRVMARAGAIAELDIVVQDPSIVGGVWVSDWFAAETGVVPGDPVASDSALEPEEPGAEVTPSGGPGRTWPVAGIYRALWSPDGTPPDGYWSEVPADLLPRYSPPFRGPTFSLLILEPGTMADSGLTGFMQWEAPSAEAVATLAGLESRVAAYGRLETSLVSDPDISESLTDLAAIRAAAPVIETSLIETLRDVTVAADALEQPLTSARTAGVVVGLAVMVAGSIFVVRQHRTSYRLLAGEGDRWPIFTPRAAAQLTAPVAVGTVIGVAAGVALGAWIGPADALRLDAVDVGLVIGIAVAGLVLAALVNGLLAQQTLDTGVIGARRSSTPLVVAVLAVGATAVLWVQVGRTPARGETTVDLAVIALPRDTRSACAGAHEPGRSDAQCWGGTTLRNA